jgi:hypothetical protein
VESVRAEEPDNGKRTAEHVKFVDFHLLMVFSLIKMWVSDSGVYCLVKCSTNGSVVKKHKHFKNGQLNGMKTDTNYQELFRGSGFL